MQDSTPFTDEINVNKIVCYEQRWEQEKGYSLYLTLPRPNHGLTYILAEKAEYTLANGESFTARRGDIVYAPQGSFYGVVFGSPDELGRSSYLINFSLDTDTAESGVRIVMRDSSCSFLSTFENAVLLYKSHTGRSFAIKAKVYGILDMLNMNAVMFSYDAPKQTKSSVNMGIAYIENNIDKVLSISELAALCHMGESTFRREFERIMGTSPLRYINFLKIEKAKELLANADFNISDIPETLGFYDLSHFYKTFKSVTGITPSRFREELKKTSPAPT